jgi:hypothetical protein
MSVGVSYPKTGWTSELAKKHGYFVTAVSIEVPCGDYQEANVTVSKAGRDDITLVCQFVNDAEEAVHDLLDSHIVADGCLRVYCDELLSS